MTTFGIIIANRGFFPDALAREGRIEILRVLEQQGYNTICLTPDETKHGAVETLADARKCADLFKTHRDQIDGVLVALPNFGDERATANTLRFAGLDAPVLLQAFPDDPTKMLMGARRDSFCGKISACNNLWQYGIKYSLTNQHTVAPDSEAFRADLANFAATCRVVKGLKNPRVGAIGARPSRLQHRALQREANGALRHYRRNAGPLRSLRPHKSFNRRRPARKGKASQHRPLRKRKQHPRGISNKNVQISAW